MISIINIFKGKVKNPFDLVYKEPDYKVKLFSDNTGVLTINYYYKRNMFSKAFDKSLRKFLKVREINTKDAFDYSAKYEIERDEKSEFLFKRIEKSVKSSIDNIEYQLVLDNAIQKFTYYSIEGMIIEDKTDFVKVSVIVQVLWIK